MAPIKKFELRNLTLELTNQCNLRCKMCGIWSEKDKKNLSLTNIKKILFSDIFEHPISSISLTGGECFMHPQFDAIFNLIKLAKVKKKFNYLDIVTNGYLTDQILSFLSRNKRFINNLEMTFSIDGNEKNHNFQRGVNNAHSKTINTILEITQKFPNVKVGIKFTVNNSNYADISNIYEFCKEHNLRFSLKLIEDNAVNYYHRLKLKNNISNFTSEQKEEISKILNDLIIKDDKNNLQILEKQYVQEIINFLKGEDTINFCLTPTYSLFITFDGKIYPCLYYPPIAILTDTDWENKIQNSQHQKIIKEAVCGECPKCLAYHGYLKSWNFKQ